MRLPALALLVTGLAVAAAPSVAAAHESLRPLAWTKDGRVVVEAQSGEEVVRLVCSAEALGRARWDQGCRSCSSPADCGLEEKKFPKSALAARTVSPDKKHAVKKKRACDRAAGRCATTISIGKLGAVEHADASLDKAPKLAAYFRPTGPGRLLLVVDDVEPADPTRRRASWLLVDLTLPYQPDDPPLVTRWEALADAACACADAACLGALAPELQALARLGETELGRLGAGDAARVGAASHRIGVCAQQLAAAPAKP